MTRAGVPQLQAGSCTWALMPCSLSPTRATRGRSGLPLATPPGFSPLPLRRESISAGSGVRAADTSPCHAAGTDFRITSNPMSGIFGGKKQQAAPAAASTVPPPVTLQNEQSPSIDAARRAALKRAQARKGFASTVRGGESNAGSSYQSTSGTRSLLGIP